MSNSFKYHIPNTSIVLDLDLDKSDEELCVSIVQQIAVQIAKVSPADMKKVTDEEWEMLASEQKEKLIMYISTARSMKMFEYNEIIFED